MSKICYVPKNFHGKTLDIISVAEAICQEYADQGFTITLRQLYYQFVARDYLPNRQQSYDKLGAIVNDARLAGLIDWDHLEDRTRNVRSLGHWRSPADIMRGAAQGYREDKWARQHVRPEVWIEKDALVGVIEGVCETNDVSFFSCRGYTSQSEMWSAAQRLLGYCYEGQTPIILHLGDHDPSGIDMTRDILDRLNLFMRREGYSIEVNRLALNMDQVQQYDPPPNPAKTTDSRYAGYIELWGDESWELDALEPTVLAALIQDAIDAIKDPDVWDESAAAEREGRELLAKSAREWVQVSEFIRGLA